MGGGWDSEWNNYVVDITWIEAFGFVYRGDLYWYMGRVYNYADMLFMSLLCITTLLSMLGIAVELNMLVWVFGGMSFCLFNILANFLALFIEAIYEKGLLSLD